MPRHVRYDPKRTSLHCSAFDPIIYSARLRKRRETYCVSQSFGHLSSLFLKRGDLLSGHARCRWNRMPLGALWAYTPNAVAA
jgi:hypothetical protein